MLALPYEIFKDIPGYEGYYKASNLGTIISLKRATTKGGIIKQELCKGYLRCNFSKLGFSKHIHSHILVAKTFISNPNNNPCINHKNGIKVDNNINNLERVSRSYNQRHAYNILGVKSWFQTRHPSKGKFGKHHRNSKPIIQYNIDGIFIKERGSMMDVERELGIKNSSICSCCKGIHKSAGGYIWEYKVII